MLTAVPRTGEQVHQAAAVFPQVHPRAFSVCLSADAWCVQDAVTLSYPIRLRLALSQSPGATSSPAELLPSPPPAASDPHLLLTAPGTGAGCRVTCRAPKGVRASGTCWQCPSLVALGLSTAGLHPQPGAAAGSCGRGTGLNGAGGERGHSWDESTQIRNNSGRRKAVSRGFNRLWSLLKNKLAVCGEEIPEKAVIQGQGLRWDWGCVWACRHCWVPQWGWGSHPSPRPCPVPPRTLLGKGMVMGAWRATGDSGGMAIGHAELFALQNKDVLSQRAVKDIYGLPCRP